ncbi:MAG: hypothetical protein JWN30_329 [Bacilli bacterium]|nr:hypothetical protein [Bacilli bacterium]
MVKSILQWLFGKQTQRKDDPYSEYDEISVTPLYQYLEINPEEYQYHKY